MMAAMGLRDCCSVERNTSPGRAERGASATAFAGRSDSDAHIQGPCGPDGPITGMPLSPSAGLVFIGGGSMLRFLHRVPETPQVAHNLYA